MNRATRFPVHRLAVILLFLFATASLACIAVAQSAQTASPAQPPVPSQSSPVPGRFPGLAPQDLRPDVPSLPEINASPNQKQKDAILKQNFQSTQRDIEKLNRLVESLQQQIKKSNSQILSLRIINQAGKIEKLAHKIKNELKAY